MPTISALAWRSPDDPRDWQAVIRAFRDRHTETWFAADATLGWWGPDGFTRLVVATDDPGTLPGKATWHLATNMPRPAGARTAASTRRRTWRDRADPRDPVLDRAELQAGQGRAGLGRVPGPLHTAIRHQALVNCAFCFCWAA